MNPKVRAWLLVLLIAALCDVLVWGVAWYRSRSLTPAAQLKRMPAHDGLVVYVDFAALRRAGILQMLDGSKVGEDPEYQGFVRKTDFDYKQDLDTAMVAFLPSGKYLLLRGRFDWKSLHAYVEGERGRCYNSVCRMAGSSPDRRISFFPVQSNVMALAVSPDETAALQMGTPGSGPDPEVPNAPVWLSLATSVLKSSQNLPDGTRMFARSMERAERVTLAFVPEGNRVSARLNVRCRNDQDAAEIAAQLSRATGMLRDMVQREHHKPNPADLSGVLTEGAFHSQGRRVFGYWPIERAFLENVLGGGK